MTKIKNITKNTTIIVGSFLVGLLVARLPFARDRKDDGRVAVDLQPAQANPKVRVRSSKGTMQTNGGRSLSKLERMERALEIGRNSHSDPQSVIAGLRAAGQLDDDSCRAIFAHWASLNPTEAMKFAMQSQNQDILAVAAATILETALEKSPNEVINLLNNLPTSGTGEILVGNLFLKWASTDLTGLEKAAKEMGSRYLKNIAFAALIGRLGEVNPGAGLALLTDMKGAQRDRALSSLITGWARQDAGAAAKYVISIGSEDMPPPVIGSLVSTWSKSDPVAALDFALGLKSANLRNIALNNVAASVTGGIATPAAISELVARVPEGKSRDDLLSTFLYNWRGDDFMSIAALVYGKGSGVVGSIAEGTLAKRWVESDYEGAKNYFDSAGTAVDRSALGQELLLQGMRIKPEENLTILTEMSAKNGSGWTSAFMDQLIKLDPTAALSAMDRLEKSGSPLGRQNFVNSYAMYEPEKTMKWITSVGFKGSAGDAALIATRRWAEIDEFAASEFVSKMPPSPMRDASASAIAGSSARSGDVKSALAWALSIKDDKLRRGGLAEIGKFIDNGDPSRYSEDILDSGISNEEIQYLEK